LEKSFFFNAVVTNGVADRTYSAEDLAERESRLLSDGVIGNESLEVVAGSGRSVYVSTGAAMIRGYTYLNTGVMEVHLDEVAEPLGRIDTLALKLDLAARIITMTVTKGEAAAAPVSIMPKGDATTHYLPIAEVYVSSDGIVESEHITDRRILSCYAGSKDDIFMMLREYIGELDPLKADETKAVRKVLSTVKTDGDGELVLCADGKYRRVNTLHREVARDFTAPGDYRLFLIDVPSEGDVYDIEIQGAGGAGGAYNGSGARGGGGGAGAYLTVTGVHLNRSSCSIRVGRGGEGVPGGDGEDGEASYFDGFVAAGGRGGEGGSSAGGGMGGIGFYNGGNGTDGTAADDGIIHATCGMGGDSKFGFGAKSTVGDGAVQGNPADIYGAGGSGATSAKGTFGKSGGRGGNGRVTVYRYVRDVAEAEA